MIFVSIKAFLEPHSSARGREKNEKGYKKTFLEASELFLNNFLIKIACPGIKQIDFH